MSEIFRGIRPLHTALDFHVARHNVLASNVANVDTPGFRPIELTREIPDASELQQMGAGAQRELLDRAREAFDLSQDESAPVGPDGNAVQLELELAKLSANDVRFEGTVKLVASQLAMLRYAASDGSSG